MAEYGVIASLLALLALAVTETFGAGLHAITETIVQAMAQVQ